MEAKPGARCSTRSTGSTELAHSKGASGNGEWKRRVEGASGNGEWNRRVEPASGRSE